MKKNNDTLSRIVLKVTSGPVGAQFIALASLPVLMFLYSPKEFGELAKYLLMTGVFSAFGCMKYDNRIGRSKTRLSVLINMNKGIIASLWAGGISLTLVLIYMMWNNIGILENLFVLAICVGVVLGGIIDLIVAYEIKSGNTSAARNIRIEYALMLVGSQIILGIFAPTVVSLALSIVIAYVPIVLRYNKKYVLKKSYYLLLRPSEIFRYKQDWFWGSGSVLTSSVAHNMPAVVLEKFIGAEIAGLYAVASRILLNPITVLTNGIAQVSISWLASDDKLNISKYMRATTLLIGFATVAMSGIAYSYRNIEGYMGASWSGFGEMIGILSIIIIPKLAFETVANYYVVYQRQQILLICRTIIVAVPIFLLYQIIDIGFKRNDQVFIYFSFQSFCYISLYIVLAVSIRVDKFHKILNISFVSFGIFVLLANKVGVISMGYANTQRLILISVLMCAAVLMASTHSDAK